MTVPLCFCLSRAQGFEVARKACLAFLDEFKVAAPGADRELLRCVARTSLRTKVRAGRLGCGQHTGPRGMQLFDGWYCPVKARSFPF